jgi:hypothetical protein
LGETFEAVGDVDADLQRTRSASGAQGMIGAPACQLPGVDLVPFGASSTERGEILPNVEALPALDTDRISRPGCPTVFRRVDGFACAVET